MGPIINWKVLSLERETETGYVFSANWLAECFFEGSFSESYGSVTLERPDNLIPYEDISEELAISWIKNALNSDESETSVEQIEISIKEKIQSQINPPILKGTPWA
jgi:hypothetical protein